MSYDFTKDTTCNCPIKRTDIKITKQTVKTINRTGFYNIMRNRYKFIFLCFFDLKSEVQYLHLLEQAFTDHI